LIRLVRTPEGELIPDLKAKLPGRGVYLCSRSSCIKRASRKNVLAHSLRESIAASELEGLEGRIREALIVKAHSFLSVLRKGNKIVVGRESIQRRLKKKEIHLLLLAKEAAEAWTGIGGGSVPLQIFFSREQLGSAVGKSPQPALGVLDERASLELIRLIEMIKGLEPGRG
jgi:predicted RNA-binding protein YlxR (DUF448 family)